MRTPAMTLGNRQSLGRLIHCATDCAMIVPWPIIHESHIAPSLTSASIVIPIAKGSRARFVKCSARALNVAIYSITKLTNGKKSSIKVWSRRKSRLKRGRRSPIGTESLYFSRILSSSQSGQVESPFGIKRNVTEGLSAGSRTPLQSRESCANTHMHDAHTYRITPFLLAGLAEPNWASTERSARGLESNGPKVTRARSLGSFGKRSPDGLVSHPLLVTASLSRAHFSAFSPHPPTMHALICFSSSSLRRRPASATYRVSYEDAALLGSWRVLRTIESQYRRFFSRMQSVRGEKKMRRLLIKIGWRTDSNYFQLLNRKLYSLNTVTNSLLLTNLIYWIERFEFFSFLLISYTIMQ